MGDHHQKSQGMSGGDGLELPPGFRFHPSDEEIITFYLMPKVRQRNFTCTTIGEVDLNRTEPSDLPGKAKIGEKQWYFFYQKDHKYATGVRMNRATEGGYWKATGKDKEIYIAGVVPPLLIGMRKTLVFYKGRAPWGKKTEWVMHEFRLEGNNKLPFPTFSSTSSTTTIKSSASENEWVVCRVFHKTTRIKCVPTPPSYKLAMANGGINQSSIPMPTPLQFPMLSDFTMDPTASYYSTIDANSPLVPPMMLPMAGMGSAGLQMDNTLFGNPMAVVLLMSSFYHPMGLGEAGVGGFMAAPESTPALMVSQKDTRVSPDQTNTIAEILSMVFEAPESAATMDIDGIWKY